MSAEPSIELIELLAHLQLATRDEILAVGRRAKRLVRGLPIFDSVWIDALLQEETLTPFQAAEIKAGRGEQLQVVDFVLSAVLDCPAYGRQFRARRLSSNDEVRLLVVEIPTGDATKIEKQLKTTIDVSRRLDNPALLPATEGGVETTGAKSRLWCVCDAGDGIAASRWLVPNGRVPHQAVLHIARQMAGALAELERYELPHADISTVNLIWDQHGRILLPLPGIRAIVRPDEGHGRADLTPDAYDYLAPERIVDGTPSDTASELYAFGALCWHLLAGRPPIPGGDSMTKLRNIQKGKTPDIRTIAPDTPDYFANVISRCMNAEPAERGASFDQIVATLGPSSRQDVAELQQCVYRHYHPQPINDQSRSRRLPPGRLGQRFALGSLSAIVLVATSWYLLQPGPAPTVHIPPPQTTVTKAMPPEAAPKRPTGAPSEASARDQRTLEPNVVLLSHKAAANGHLPRLSAGVTVRGDPQQRPVFRIPAEGIALDVPHVRFEHVDFVWQNSNDLNTNDLNTNGLNAVDQPAMVRLSSRWVEFHRCSFQAGDVPFGHQRPVAVTVIQNAQAESISAVHIVMDQCVLRDVDAGVGIGEGIALTFQAQGTLYLGPGPLIDLQDWPRLDLPMRLALRQCTLRNATALVSIHGGYDSQRPGNLSVLAEYCVFSPRADGSLFKFENAEQAPPFLRRIHWSGHSSLLAADATLLARQSADGQTERIDDSPIAIEGLIRGDFEFESPQLEIPAASGLRDWSVPTRGAARPGINDVDVHLPKIGNR